MTVNTDSFRTTPHPLHFAQGKKSSNAVATVIGLRAGAGGRSFCCVRVNRV